MPITFSTIELCFSKKYVHSDKLPILICFKSILESLLYFVDTPGLVHGNLPIKNSNLLVAECMLGVVMIILPLGLSILFNFGNLEFFNLLYFVKIYS